MDLVDRFDVVMYAALTDVRPSQAGQWLWDNDLGGETEEAHAEVVPWFSNYLDKAWQDFSNRRLYYSPATDFMEIWRFPTKEHARKLCRVVAPPEISKVLWHSYGGPWGTLDLEKD
ncbi:uncharacterized protein LOC127751381 [Frankliniella occidentalis]|uniref:Uncharacterized protein LOC127751381 n=1 Tax=Frankliniella occidentalis TaxID=133901 RepID=A0A9C6X7S5_FRAOC|nr:uncharacterized protein LOC127751381 [Frankliniella occidentalis]